MCAATTGTSGAGDEGKSRFLIAVSRRCGSPEAPKQHQRKVSSMKTIVNGLLQGRITPWVCLATLLSFTVASLAEGKRTYFEGTETSTPTDPGAIFTDGKQLFIKAASSAAIDICNDQRLAGNSVITYDAVLQLADQTGQMWGTYRLSNQGGSWDSYWQGTRTAFVEGQVRHQRTSLVGTMIGCEGYTGLIAYYVYESQDGGPASIKGYTIEAKGGPGERPMTWRATRTEELVFHYGTFVLSGQPGAMGTFDFLSEVGMGTHIGRSTNDGFGLVDLVSGVISGSGCLATASKDLVYWVATGSVDLATGTATVTIHFAGGTGRFEAAVGEMSGTFTPVWEDGPLVLHSTFDWRATGTIRY